MTNAGAIGTAAGRVVCTGEGGVLEAADTATAAALLGVDGKAPLTHAARHAAGGADTVTPAAIGAAAAEHTHTPAAIGAVAAAEKGAAGGVAELDGNGRVQGEQACSNVVEHYNITNYTMSTDDVGKAHTFLMPSGSSATMTVTLPASLPIGTEFEMLKSNAGTTLVVSAGTGATISTINKSGQSSVRAGSGKFALITLKRYNQNWWFATGADE